MTIDVGDPVLAASLEETRDQINRVYAQNSPGIQNPHGATQVHLDFVTSEKLNAIAFVYEDRPFIAITTALLRRLGEIASQMWRLNLVAPMLGIVLDQDTRNRFAGTLLVVQLQVLASHELGHHFHGHCASDADNEIAEFAFEDVAAINSAIVPNRLRDQAMEVEADGYATHHMLQNFFSGGIGGNLHRILVSGKGVEDFTLTYFLLATGSLLYLWGSRSFSAEDVYMYRHPPALSRLNVVMTDLGGWLSLNHPHLQDWATIERFQAVMTAVAAAAEGKIDQAPWEAQGTFLRSVDGQRYTDNLYAVRATLRAEMQPYQWHLSSS
jgi:hypothetical protein